MGDLSALRQAVKKENRKHIEHIYILCVYPHVPKGTCRLVFYIKSALRGVKGFQKQVWDVLCSLSLREHPGFHLECSHFPSFGFRLSLRVSTVG